jgi:polyferredoxin
VYGPVRSAKWAILVFCLAVYYTLPWLRWDRGPGVPNQALLLDLLARAFLFLQPRALAAGYLPADRRC